MILRRTSPEFRKFFLLQFTKELIRNSIPKDILLKQTLRNPEGELNIQPVNDLKEKVLEGVFQTEKKELSPTRIEPIVRREFKPLPQTPRVKPRPTGPLRIPIENLPQRLQYIKPMPMPNKIDLGRLNPLIKNPMVQSIECNGPEIRLIVKGMAGTKEIEMTLSEEHISEVIRRFSQKSRIPVSEGIYRVVVGKLILSAIISEITGTKFIIAKMGYR